MNQWRKWLMVALGGIVLAAALALAGAGESRGQEAPLAPRTIYVDLWAVGANDGSSWANAYTTLQPALDQATAGDEIWVAAGTYKPTQELVPGEPRSATFQLKNGVALYGGFDPSVGDTGWDDRDWAANAAILSGELGSPALLTDNSYHVFYQPAGLALDATAVLDGFVITGGYAHASGHLRGGGMYNEGASPMVRHCTFVGNSAATGGGMANYDASSPTVTDCTFSENEAAIGGGMANYNASSPMVTHSRFLDNDCSSGNGGGMFNDHSSPTVSSCTFAGNTAGSGAGMYNYSGSSPVVTNCIFVGNSAGNGAGLKNYAATAPVVTNCTFSGNSAEDYGGGIYSYASNFTMANSIAWGNTPDEIDYDSTAPVVSYSDVQGGYGGTANIDEDPQFEDQADGDVDLLAGSPCIDAGSNAAPSLPSADFEGDPRVWDGDLDGTATADMGADEFGFHTLAVRLEGDGSGTVEQAPDDVHLAHSTTVTLTATADPGSSFSGWSGDADGTTNPTMLAMDMDKVVTATFTLLESHALTLHYAGSGSGLVNLDPPGGVYDDGTVVTLTAAADPGSSFGGWSGDASGTTNPITLIMDAAKVVTATFTLETHTLTIGYAGNGSGLVSLDPPGGLYDYGTGVTLTAVPDPGSVFAGWSGDASGTTNPTTLTMDADKVATATFITYRVYVPLVAKQLH